MSRHISIEDALASWIQLTSESPRLDVECLLCHVLGCDSAYLRTWPDKPISTEQHHEFNRLLAKRINGEPIAYICGTRAFWTLELQVSPDTLIPRPDTEILVEKILSLDLPNNASILDLGTGTGAIALALASERPLWQITATDFKSEAVTLAMRNAQQHNLSRVNIFQSDWFDQIPAGCFDLIVSNPPYINPDDEHLSQGDVRFEPRSALIANNKGLADLEHIVQNAKPFLKNNAWLVLEHGYDQAEAVKKIFQQASYEAIESVKDYGQQDRMTMARLNKGPF